MSVCVVCKVYVFLCMCVHMLMIVQMHVHIFVRVCGSLELISDIFLMCIPFYRLKRGLLLDPEFSFDWSGYPSFSGLTFAQTGITGGFFWILGSEP